VKLLQSLSSSLQASRALPKLYSGLYPEQTCRKPNQDSSPSSDSRHTASSSPAAPSPPLPASRLRHFSREPARALKPPAPLLCTEPPRTSCEQPPMQPSARRFSLANRVAGLRCARDVAPQQPAAAALPQAKLVLPRRDPLLLGLPCRGELLPHSDCVLIAP
jgi:hypothetical protein